MESTWKVQTRGGAARRPCERARGGGVPARHGAPVVGARRPRPGALPGDRDAAPVLRSAADRRGLAARPPRLHAATDPDRDRRGAPAGRGAGRVGPGLGGRPRRQAPPDRAGGVVMAERTPSPSAPATPPQWMATLAAAGDLNTL